MRWRDFSDEALKDLKYRIRAGRDGMHWIEEIAAELRNRHKSQEISKEFYDSALEEINKIES